MGTWRTEERVGCMGMETQQQINAGMCVWKHCDLIEREQPINAYPAHYIGEVHSTCITVYMIVYCTCTCTRFYILVYEDL